MFAVWKSAFGYPTKVKKGQNMTGPQDHVCVGEWSAGKKAPLLARYIPNRIFILSQKNGKKESCDVKNDLEIFIYRALLRHTTTDSE